MKRGGLWKCRAMDAEENQIQVFLRAHSPWKSQQRRFPHSHSPGDEARGKVEIQTQDSHFPTGPVPLSKTNQKGGPAADRFAPASRLILQ